jgi:hypothetical protein
MIRKWSWQFLSNVHSSGGALRRFLRRLANVIRPGREEPGLEREIASHLGLSGR